MKKEDKWIQDMRKCMEDYSEPLPSHLWEELEQELSTPKVIPMWRRWQVAATVLALAVSSLTVWFWHSPSAQYVQQTAVIPQDVLPYTTKESVQPDLTAQETGVPETSNSLSQILSVTRSDNTPLTSGPELLPTPGFSTVAYRENSKEESPTDSETDIENTKEQQNDSQLRQQRMNADRKQMQRNQYLAHIQKGTDKKTKWSVGLLTGNTPYSTTSSFGGFGRLDSRTLSVETLNPTNRIEAAYSQILLNNREQTTQTDIHHRMPVTIGTSVKWNFNEDWAIESGITYTFLSSELHSGSSSYVEEEQKLHYIGIPLKIHRTIWQNKHFNFYASAGGMIEKCVSGELETTYAYGFNKNEKENRSLEITPLQCSVTAAVGAQFNIAKQFGFYVEPGMAYYFDDGSSIETIRKQHPFNFNLQLGLRFNFSK